MGRTAEVCDMEPLEAKWKAFGWNVIEINGHYMQQIISSLDKSSKLKNKKPTIIISNTIKGKGVSFMELNHKFRGKAPNDEEYKKAIEERLMIDPIGFGKPLRYSLKGHRRLLVSDYRIVYRIDADTVIIVSIKHRKDVYDDF